MPDLRWTTEPPTSGWWWWTDEFCEDAAIGCPVVVCVADGEAFDLESDGWKPLSEWIRRGVLWLGPFIAPPRPASLPPQDEPVVFVYPIPEPGDTPPKTCPTCRVFPCPDCGDTPPKAGGKGE